MRGTPKYQEIIDYIQNQIDNKVYVGDSRLPTEEALAKQFQTSRPTVVKAMDRLREQKVVYRIQGKGSFVTPNKPILPSQDSKLISVVLPFAEYRDKGRLDEMNILKGVARVLDRNGYFTMIHYCKDDTQDFIKAIKTARNSISIGTIAYVAKGTLNAPEIYDLFIGDYPIVLIDKTIIGANCPCVQSDNIQGATSAVSHLINCNYQYIYFISDHDFTSSTSFRERYIGFCQGVQQYRNKTQFGHYMLNSDEDEKKQLEQIAIELVQKHKNERVGLFYTSDYLALTAYDALLKVGANIPENFGIVGFDGLGYKTSDNSILTSMAQDYYGIGKTASATMLELLDNQPAHNNIVKMEVSLIQGDTTVKL